MFNVNGTQITISCGDTGAMRIKAVAKRRDTGADYIFGPRDRALFSIKSGNTVVKEKIYEIINAIMTVEPAARTAPDEPITAQIDKSAFNAATGNTDSGTMTFTYTSGWDNDPEEYGITVYGTPVSGDVITVDYVKNEFIVTFMNADTDSLAPGGYSWDVRYVINPYYNDLGRIVDGDQVITPNQPMGAQLLNVVGDI